MSSPPTISALDPFIPKPDVRERFETTIGAPAALVMETAANFDIQSPVVVRAIFRLREMLMRAPRSPARRPQGLLSEMRSLGWGLLVEEPGRLIVCGSACRPWLADSGFRPIPSDGFAAYSEPDQVKIAWTLEAEALGPALTRFAHETRAVATEGKARTRFLRYWRWARLGIISIRLLLLPAIRQAAERRWRDRDKSQKGLRR